MPFAFRTSDSIKVIFSYQDQVGIERNTHATITRYLECHAIVMRAKYWKEIEENNIRKNVDTAVLREYERLLKMVKQVAIEGELLFPEIF